MKLLACHLSSALSSSASAPATEPPTAVAAWPAAAASTDSLQRRRRSAPAPPHLQLAPIGRTPAFFVLLPHEKTHPPSPISPLPFDCLSGFLSPAPFSPGPGTLDLPPFAVVTLHMSPCPFLCPPRYRNVPTNAPTLQATLILHGPSCHRIIVLCDSLGSAPMQRTPRERSCMQLPVHCSDEARNGRKSAGRSGHGPTLHPRCWASNRGRGRSSMTAGRTAGREDCGESMGWGARRIRGIA
mgnify:CR=1 FL=1